MRIDPGFQGIQTKDMSGKTMERGNLRFLQITQGDLNFFSYMRRGHMIALLELLQVCATEILTSGFRLTISE